MSKKKPIAKVQEVPAALDSLLGAGKVRDLSNVTDICAEAMSALLHKQMGTAQSRELRQWTELMFTCLQVEKGVHSDGDVNYITQLVNIEAAKMEAPQIVEVEQPQPKKVGTPTEEIMEAEIADEVDWDFLLQATA